MDGTIIRRLLSHIMKEDIKIDEDADSVSRCRKGDTEAFEDIVRKYQKKMFNISYRITGDYHDAAEAVQDAFVSAYRNIRRFSGRSKFSTWLYTITVNMSRNRLKQVRTRESREPSSIDDPVDTDNGHMQREYASSDLSVLDRLEKHEIERKVQGCISALDGEFREVIVLRDIQGFSYDEIGDMLEIAEGTVKSRLFRARDAVRKCLKKLMGEVQHGM